jgi:hypothetical protein
MEVNGRHLHAPAALSLGNYPGSHCTGGCVGPRADLDVSEKRKIAAVSEVPTRCSGFRNYKTEQNNFTSLSHSQVR